MCRDWRPILRLLLSATCVVGFLGCSDDPRTTGNAITIGYFDQPDSLDPALGFQIPSAAALNQVYLPLLTYRRVEGPEGTTLIPGLAEQLPEVTPDGRIYIVQLRSGLVYSDGTRVKASDFEHAIKRVLNLGSPGAPLYERIAGAKAYERGGNPDGDITGIEADDRLRQVAIRLERPYAAFADLLALPFAAPVPANTPFRNMTEKPPPGTGPFRIARSEPNREFVLERNSRFRSLGIEGVPAASLDRITVRVGLDKAKQAEDVLAGRLDYMSDSPPPDLLPRVRKEAGDRYEDHVLASTNWFFLNGRLPPFDDPDVRRAVNLAVDKPALERVYAGGLVSGCSFLPPDMAGYDEELDTTRCPFGDAEAPPDVASARELVRSAGADGAKVTVWTFGQPPQSDVAESYAEMLNGIGLDADVRTVDFTVWRQAIGNAKNRPQTGVEGWTQVFPHPLTFFALVDGSAIRPTNNRNTSNVDDPVINTALRRLEGERDLDSVRDEWRRLNRYLVGKAYLVPYGHRVRGTFVSERIDFENCTVFHQIYLEDWSRFCLKEGEE